MLNWAFRQWLFQPARLLLTMVVFAGVLALAMLFDGIRIGLVEDIREFPASLQADLVALKTGNNYFAMGPSSLPLSSLMDVGGVDGVAGVAPLAMAPFILANDGIRTPSMLVAYDTVGKPENFVSGGAPGASGGEMEVAMDSRLAYLNGLETGDRVEILGSELTISGLSLGTSSAFTPYSFVTYESFIKIVGEMAMARQAASPAEEMSLISVLLIDLEEGADIEKVRADLEAAVSEADFFTPSEIGDADANFANRLMGPVLILLSAMTWIITLLTMVVLRHGEVQANLQQFGIQKALGARPLMLGVALAFGGVLIAISALPLALVFARGLAWVMGEWNPLYGSRVWDLAVIGRAFLISLVAAIAGSILVWRKLARIEPTVVFKR